jgi:hypothetical protein
MKGQIISTFPPNEYNPATMGAGLLGMFFLVVVGLSIDKSKERLNTTLYTLAAMALTFGLVMGVAQVFPTLNTEATGAATMDVMLFIGMLTALIHSRKNRA